MAGARCFVVSLAFCLACAVVPHTAKSIPIKPHFESNIMRPSREDETDVSTSDPVGIAEGQSRPEAEIRQAPYVAGSQPGTTDGTGIPHTPAAESGSPKTASAVAFFEEGLRVGTGQSSDLESRLAEELSAHIATQAVLLIDGGSSKTQPVVFKVQTVGRPGMHRVVLEDTIKLVGEGTKRQGVREILEKFLDGAAGADWESRPLETEELARAFPDLEAQVAEFVVGIIEETAIILEQHLTPEEKSTAKSLGVPVLFNSTAGIRDFPVWCASGLFVAVRRAVNIYPVVSGYKFYTDPALSRTLSGEEEGVFAFLTANLLLGNLRRLRRDAAEGLTTRAHERLVGIVEVGGASMQLVLPLSVTILPPASVRVVKMHEAGYLSSEYPPVAALAVSYMQLGADGASGAFLKGLCSQQRVLRGGVCYNPCLHKNFQQSCSAGPVTITPDGEVQVNTELRKNRLKPLATYCGEANEDVTRRHTTRLTCLAARMIPTGSSLRERVEIPNCNKIVGNGDFGECVRSVDSLLLNSTFALPANTEAEGVGFDTPGQIFPTISSSAPLLVTGAAVVFPINNLKKLGLLPEDFSGDTNQLEQAATAFCNSPMQREENKLVVRVGDKELILDSFTYEDCLRLAFIKALLTRLNSGKEKPVSVKFSTKVVDPASGQVKGSAGWPIGRIFKEAQDRGKWSLLAYENGPAYSLGFSKTSGNPMPTMPTK